MSRSFLLTLCIFLAASAARADYIDHFATRTDVGPYKIPSQGKTRVLVIPVIIDDQPFSTDSEQAFIDELDDFFATDDRSVFDGGFRFTPYWEQASLGRFRPEVTLAAPVHFATCPPIGGHADCAIPRGAGITDGDLLAAARTLGDAMRFLDEIVRCAAFGPSQERRCTSGGDITLEDFDTLGNQPAPDGFTDGVIVISNAQFPGIALPVKDLADNALVQSLAGPLPSFTYAATTGGEITIPSIGIAGFERAPQRETFVAVHEFGHLLGFADLYNEAGTTTDLPYTVMGGWFYSTAASLLDPFSRIAIGWANVIDVAGPATISLPSAARTGVVLKVGSGDEFFLVEHRTKHDGQIDGDLSVSSGVFIERVSLQHRPPAAPGNYIQTLQDCVNCRPFDSLLIVEEADGRYDLQVGGPRDDAADLFTAGQSIAPSDDTTPRNRQNRVFSTNLIAGARTDITITVDSSDDDGAVITIDAPTKDACADLTTLCAQPCTTDSDGHGRCGNFEVFGAIADPVDDELDGCAGCTASSSTPWALLLSLLLLRRRHV